MELPVWTQSSGVRKKSYILETKNLSFKLCGWFERYFSRKAETAAAQKVILHNVNCEARPGGITAIAGPSGAGKTTLLEVLAGKISQNEVSGQVLVNGRPVNSRCFQGLSGYVTQDDALFPLLTVEETLMYSALLRLPGGLNQAASRVKEVLRVLGLNHIAGSRIGKGSNHGVSGGERRRVSIGVELVHDPAVILIDEPTSGLDSGSALLVVALLKSMAVNQGKTIVLTVHQPGFRILQLLDRLVLLSNGYVVHNGPLDLLEQNLISTGHRIPRSVNLLEYAIDVIECLPEHTPATSQILFHLEKNNSETKETKDQSSQNGYSNIFEENNLHHPNSPFEEVAILGRRFCSNIFRTKELFTTRILQALIAGIVLGTIFFNAGKEQSKLSLQTQTGFFAFSLTFLLSSITEGLPIYLQERRILERETARGAYRISSYVLANTFIFIPFLLIVGLVYSTPVYWLVGLKKDIEGFLYFSLVVWMVLMMSNSFVACFSALVPNFIMGTSVIAGLMGSFFLFSGYFISKENIPKYWIFMHHLSLFKYPFECFMINEYGDQGSNRCIEFKNGQCSLYGSTFLRQQDLVVSQKWTNLALMLGFIIGYRVLSFFILWYRCCRNRN